MIIFRRYETSSLYQPASPRLDDGGYFAYLLLSQPEVSPESLTLEESWRDYAGFYLFLKNAPQDLAAFADAARLKLEAFAPTHASFAWLTCGVAEVEVVGRIQVQAGATVAADTRLSFLNYAVPFKRDSPVTLDSPTSEYSGRFLFAYPPIPHAPPPAKGKGIRLPLTGRWRGCVEGEVLVGDFSDDYRHGWNVGCRYFFRRADKVSSQLYPVFDLARGTQVLFGMKWDPLDHLNRERTHLSFTGLMFKLDTSGGPDPVSNIEPLTDSHGMPSYFRTLRGQQVNLRPLVRSPNPPRLVFEKTPGAAGVESYYLAPAGDFELSLQEKQGAPADAAEQAASLLCGLVGTEYVEFVPASKSLAGDVLTFHPGSPAYAPLFPLRAGGRVAGTAPGDCGPGDLLCNDYRTSWASVGPAVVGSGPPPVYYSAPEQSSLFGNANASATADALNIMDAFPAPAAEFTGTTGQKAFPLAPYAGVSLRSRAEGAELRRFELEIIGAQRKKEIDRIAPGRNDSQGAGDPSVTTTPQGLLATVNGFKWESVLLAQNRETGQRLEFVDEQQGIPPALKNALQSSQLFLVVSRTEALGTFKNSIDIEDWPFTVNVGAERGGNLSNVLIFKFCKGTVAELLRDPLGWTDPDTFNTDPQRVSSWLNDYVEDARRRQSSDTAFRTFVEAVSSPAWNGILALAVDISLQNFPEDLKGLLGGIDLARFNAHHLGVEVNYVEPERIGRGLRIPKSSLFALISYIDPAYAVSQGVSPGAATALAVSPAVAEDPGQDGYDFRVLTLQVVFQNSEVKDFSSKIQLSLTRWFGEPAFSVCTIRLNGSYETHNNKKNYAFTTLRDQNYQFFLDSKVQNYIQITKAQFSAYDKRDARQAPAAESSQHVASIFPLWGYMNFWELEGYDLFSFGGEAGQEGSINRGAYFYNLAVRMEFDLVTQQTASGDLYEVRDRRFGFEAENISFDLTRSTLHAESLYGHFPLVLTGMASGGKDSKPQDMGYVLVQPPNGVSLSPLGENWYGLVCTLNLGSMGALAANAGFVANLLLAWSPSTEQAKAAVLVKLPGVGGKKTLSFQNVLRLAVDSFKFDLHRDGAGSAYYSLTLRNIGLSLLGMRLPPGGNTNVVLFGNPEANNTAPGWYGAYYRKKA